MLSFTAWVFSKQPPPCRVVILVLASDTIRTMLYLKKKRLLYGLSLLRTYVLEEILLGLETLRLGIKLSVRILCIWPSHLSFTAVTTVDSQKLNWVQLLLYLEMQVGADFRRHLCPLSQVAYSCPPTQEHREMDFASVWACLCNIPLHLIVMFSTESQI